jgi:hypothetical protein
MLNALKGYKSIIGFAVSAAYLIAIELGYLDSNEAVWGLIILWTGVSLRMGMKPAA